MQGKKYRGSCKTYIPGISQVRKVREKSVKKIVGQEKSGKTPAKSVKFSILTQIY